MTNEASRLNSWKEIGAYLGRDARTAQRWEKEERLPVHRHSHKSRASVYAFPGEIDAWRASRKLTPEPPPPLPLWKSLLAGPRSLAFGVTVLLCLLMVGNGIRPQAASAQGVARRRVWAPADSLASVTRDGQTFAYVNRKGEIVLRDAAAGTERVFTNRTGVDAKGEAENPRISPDGTQIVYGWYPDPSGSGYELHIASLSGDLNPRLLFRRDDVSWIYLAGWSPDGKRLGVAMDFADQFQRLGTISVGDGSWTALKTLGWDQPDSISFSPDGRYLAYDLMHGQDLERRDVYVIAADGSGETAVVDSGYNSVAGWSPDGSRLLFLKDRNGNLDIWGIPMAGGKPQGPAARMLANSGNIALHGVTDSGTLFYSVVPDRTNEVQVASIDFTTAKITPLEGARGTGSNLEWSPDGKEVAYLTPRRLARRTLSEIAIRNIATGQERRLRRTFTFLGEFRWAPDGRSFAAWGTIPKGRYGVYRVDAQTGAISPIVLSEGGFTTVVQAPEWSPDSTKIYYRKRSFKNGKVDYISIMEREVASGAERELARVRELPVPLVVSQDGKRIYIGRNKVDGTQRAITAVDLASGKETEMIRRPGLGGINLSPDSRFVATVDRGARAGLLVPSGGGEARELMRVDAPQVVGFAMWAPDSKSAFFWKSAPGGTAELWRTPVDGTASQKVADYSGRAPFRVSPDGRHVASLERGPAGEVEMWALENFLPPAGSR